MTLEASNPTPAPDPEVHAPEPDDAHGRGSDQLQVAIVLYPGFTTLDAVGPYEVLRFLTNVEIRFVAHEPGPIVTDSGVLVVGATHSFDETPAPDVVLVPGSEAETVTAMADGALLDWLRRVHETSRYTLSVCSGAMILAAAGILRDRPATTHWIAQDRLGRFGAQARRDERIVRSGKVITAAGVSAGIDLGFHVVTELAGPVRAQEIQLMIEYDPQPPHDSGHPSKASAEVFEAARTELLARARNRRNLVSVPKLLWRQALDRVRQRSAEVR